MRWSARAPSTRSPSRPWSRFPARRPASSQAANFRFLWPRMQGAEPVAAAINRAYRRVEAVRRQPGLYADGACRRRHQPRRRAGSQLDRPERLDRRQQSDDPRSADSPRQDDRRTEGRGELRARWSSPEGLPGHGPAVPDPRLAADHRHAVPFDGLPARRDRVADDRDAAPGSPGAGRQPQGPDRSRASSRTKRTSSCSAAPTRASRRFRRSSLRLGRRLGSIAGAGGSASDASRPASKRNMAMSSKLLMIVPLAVWPCWLCRGSDHRFLRSWSWRIGRIRQGGSDDRPGSGLCRGRRAAGRSRATRSPLQ